MSAKEATARIKINKLLESAGWRFFADDGKSANIRLEPGVTIKTSDLDALGAAFVGTVALGSDGVRVFVVRVGWVVVR